MPQKRSGIGAADELRMEAMPHSSYVQPAMVGSTGSVSIAVFVLSVSIVGVTLVQKGQRDHRKRRSERARTEAVGTEPVGTDPRCGALFG